MLPRQEWRLPPWILYMLRCATRLWVPATHLRTSGFSQTCAKMALVWKTWHSVCLCIRKKNPKHAQRCRQALPGPKFRQSPSTHLHTQQATKDGGPKVGGLTKTKWNCSSSLTCSVFSSPQISTALEEDPNGQKMQLAYRLQQISALVENKVTDL